VELAVFDFRSIDTTLEGATYGPHADAQACLATLACGDRSLARESAARFAVTGWKQNPIRNTKIVERDADFGHLNRRGESDKFRSRTLDGLLRDDLMVQECFE
jgi:hypothetical protein